jgi:hypothetical protein
LIFKVLAIAILGGLVVGLLSVNRGQSIVAIEGVPIVIPLVLSVMIGVAPKAFEKVQDLVKLPVVPVKLCKLPVRYGAAGP